MCVACGSAYGRLDALCRSLLLLLVSGIIRVVGARHVLLLASSFPHV